MRAGEPTWELTGKAAVVLAWVALEGYAERRRLSATLWPKSDPEQGRNNLRVLVHRINQRWGAELLVGAEQLALDGSQVQLQLYDTEALLSALRMGGAKRCELLADAGAQAEAGEELQAWLQAARQRLKQVQLAGLSEALVQALDGSWHERAVTLAQACVQLDPLSEQWHRQLMEVLVRAGDRAAALTAYEECKTVLRQHLGVLPDPQTRAVQLRILQQQAQGLVPRPAAQQTPQADGLTPLGGAAGYPLVEREAVLVQAQMALEQGVHVVVQGEPGVGKTRLLRHLAATVGDQAERVAIRSGLKHEPYAALAQLLQEVQPRRAPRIGMPEQIELARLAPLAFAGVRPSEAPLSALRLHAALRHWLDRLAQVGVRVLMLDDVQHADGASQAAIGALLMPGAQDEGHSQPAPLLLLAHRSGESDAALDEALVAAQVDRRARSIALQRLSLKGVQTLLQAMDAAQRTPEPEVLAAQLLKRTGGNPLFVIELARQALEQGPAADIGSLQALLGSRFKSCSVAAQQLAAVAAVATDDFTVELASAVLAQPALALMPAWGELQQRGLFAEHGLAHDLVRDAMLVGLPQAIRQLLHRQVAQYLEGQGLQGAAVLRHWLASDNAEQALPHAAYQLYETSAAGLSTDQQELDLLALLERASDAVLMDNLWLTGEIDSSSIHHSRATEVAPRLRALWQRVERLPEHRDSAAWIAFEQARSHLHLDRSVKAAYEVLAPAALRLPSQGLDRAHAELILGVCAFQLSGDPRIHVHRARQALVGLPEQLSLRRARTTAEEAAAMFLDPVEGIRSLAARWRAGRRRGDLALVADAAGRMAYIHTVLGNHARSFRHYCRGARAQPGNGEDADRFQHCFFAGCGALNSGHYQLAHRLFIATKDSTYLDQMPLYLALLRLRLGDMQQARMHADRVDARTLQRHFTSQFIHAHVCAELDHVEGRDPVPGLNRQLAQMRELGMGGTNVDWMAWAILLHTHSAAERLDSGEALLAVLRQSNSPGARLGRVLLEVAEARADVEAAGSVELATEAARMLRRGFSHATLYIPEGLVRCARLIGRRDATEAAALVHVARRWVREALQHVPQDSRDGFVRNVAVNRLLLGQDEQAVYREPLR